MVAGLLDDVAEPPRYSLLDSVSGLCDNVTSGAVVDVFYTRAGLAQRTPLYTIVGASITYVVPVNASIGISVVIGVQDVGMSVSIVIICRRLSVLLLISKTVVISFCACCR